MEHLHDLDEIGRYGVMGTHTLIINGVVKAVGTTPPKSKIRAWLDEAAKDEI